MRILPIAVVLTLTAGILSAYGISTTSTGAAENSRYGDINCDSRVDTADVMTILSVASFGGGGSPQAELCQPQVAPDEPFMVGDLNCDGISNLIDALALLREFAGVPLPTSGGNCPMASDDVGAPETGLTCEAYVAGVGEAVACRYDISESRHGPSRDLT